MGFGSWVKGAVSDVGKGFQAVGKKAKQVGNRIGHKLYTGARRTYNYALDHAGDIADISGKVSDVAGYVQKGATAVGGAIALTGVGLPLAGAVESIGGLAGTISKGAGYVQKGAQAVEMAKQKGILTRATRSGGFSGAVHTGKFKNLM